MSSINYLASCTVHSLCRALSINLSNIKKSRMTRNELWADRWEAQTLPLCYAPLHFLSYDLKRRFERMSKALIQCDALSHFLGPFDVEKFTLWKCWVLWHVQVVPHIEWIVFSFRVQLRPTPSTCWSSTPTTSPQKWTTRSETCTSSPRTATPSGFLSWRRSLCSRWTTCSPRRNSRTT